MTDAVLADEQVASFVEHGHVTIPGCFTRKDAQPLLDEAWVRLGYDPHDPDTWESKRVHMPSLRHVEVRDFAPKVWGAACQLLGGEERIEQPYTWGNGFIANLGLGADRDWEPPSAARPGWHKDGDFFRHFLDSPEQGLLTIVLWSDIEPRGGGTFVASDSVASGGTAARRAPRGHPARRLRLRRPRRAVHELRGDHRPPGRRRAHASLRPARGLAEPSRHGAVHHQPADRAEGADALRPGGPGEHSPVERAVLRALGVERLDYQPAAPREERRSRARAATAADERRGAGAPGPGAHLTPGSPG